MQVLGKALSFHPNVPGLWIYAAAWEFEHNLNVNAARALMLSGIRACPKSEILWLEYFRMELTFVSKLRARKIALGLDKVSSLNEEEEEKTWKEENSDLFMPLNGEKLDDGGTVENENDELETNADVIAIRELGFKMSYAIFNKAIDAIPSSLRFRQLFVEMLDSLEVEKATILEDEICRSMLKEFSSDECCWDWLARRHLKKFQRGKHIGKEKVVAGLNKTIQVSCASEYFYLFACQCFHTLFAYNAITL
jgi:U3 small nucleolar RNA-associated protein 6